MALNKAALRDLPFHHGASQAQYTCYEGPILVPGNRHTQSPNFSTPPAPIFKAERMTLRATPVSACGRGSGYHVGACAAVHCATGAANGRLWGMEIRGRRSDSGLLGFDKDLAVAAAVSLVRFRVSSFLTISFLGITTFTFLPMSQASLKSSFSLLPTTYFIF